METTIYQRIKDLCDKNNLTISKLESELNFGNGSINKWNKSTSPSVDKILRVANYFCVSVDYLLGVTDIEKPVADVIENEDIIAFQRAREKMSKKDRERMMQILKLGFEDAFSDSEE